ASRCAATISFRTLTVPSYSRTTLGAVHEFADQRGQLHWLLLGHEVAAEWEQLEPATRAGDVLGQAGAPRRREEGVVRAPRDQGRLVELPETGQALGGVAVVARQQEAPGPLAPLDRRERAHVLVDDVRAHQR